jgi:hypothetical protein
MLKDVSWSGDINTLPRNIDVQLMNSVDKQGDKRAVPFDVGDMVILKYDDSEIFRGFIFKRSIDEIGSESFTAYDELIYAVKNSTSTIVKKKTASAVITEQMKKFGIEIGSIESTKIVIPKKVFQGSSINEIWEQCLEYEKSKTGKSYHIFSSKGKVYMWSREKASKATISINDIISGTQEVSIEDLKTQVLVTKGNIDPTAEDAKSKDFVPYKEVLIVDKEGVQRYGQLQTVEEADDKDTLASMKNRGNTILGSSNKPETTSNIDFIGNVNCITGRIIEVTDPTIGLSGVYYITSDNHTFSNGVHKMSLQISKKLE